ncbi:MAG TPA: hypothetical protein VMV92_15810 [Streptosporangiaceae bacterium]|nr:hypothetical protein [Streptosporangiaceae bacterium]HUZ52832.1 hypothetical protein [Streptosporangiaceae bacterium]
MAASGMDPHDATTPLTIAELRTAGATFCFRGQLRAGARSIKFPDGNVLVAR